MCGTLMYQTCLNLESIKDDLFRLDYCVGKILELSAVTTDTQERIFEFAQSRPEIYNCVDKVVCLILVYLIIRSLPDRFLIKLPYGKYVTSKQYDESEIEF